MSAQTEKRGRASDSVHTQIIIIIGPTASGKSSLAVEEALVRSGEIISVDSRQVYRGLDIGTEKITTEEKRGIPHHLIDIREPHELYSAGDFVHDAHRLIEEISARGNLPILVGGTHFYIDALIHGLPATVEANMALREELDQLGTDELFARIRAADPRRASELDPRNRRRLVRALEIVHTLGAVPPRAHSSSPVDSGNHPPLGAVAKSGRYPTYDIDWIVVNPERDELRKRIDARLQSAIEKGLIEEVQRVRDVVGDRRLTELGLEYSVIGEFLRGERSKDSLLPTLSAKLWQYARRQKAWLRKLGQK